MKEELAEARAARILRRDLASQVAGLRVTVADGATSMTPTISPGTEVTVFSEEVHRGDVVLLDQPNAMVLHRVLWTHRLSPWLIHQGDSANSKASVAKVKNIVGVARGYWRPVETPRLLSGIKQLPKKHLVVKTLRRRVSSLLS